MQLKYTFSRKPKKRIEILLDPPIPPSMHEINPRNCLGNNWWQAKRREVLAESGEYCQCCAQLFTGIPDCHERYDYKYFRLKGKVKVTLKEVVVICKLCHHFIHRGWLRHAITKGKYPKKYRTQVMTHGLELIKGQYLSDHPAWAYNIFAENWYLEIEGQKFKGSLKNKSYQKANDAVI